MQIFNHSNISIRYLLERVPEVVCWLTLVDEEQIVRINGTYAL